MAAAYGAEVRQHGHKAFRARSTFNGERWLIAHNHKDGSSIVDFEFVRSFREDLVS
ncbi:MAG: hypothetical protein H0X36_11295 [Sphingomonadaceae bacterium]|nr:hypothetical protein [Sphingomonadaceae bacterium]